MITCRVLGVLFCLATTGHAGTPSTMITLEATQEGRLSWSATEGRLYQIQCATSLEGPWQRLPTNPATFLASSNVVSHSLPLTDTVGFFRVLELPDAKVVPVSQHFERRGVAVDPILGTVSATDAPVLRVIDLPEWVPGRGVRRVEGTMRVVGVGTGNCIFGTVPEATNTDLYVSNDDGTTWSLLGRISEQTREVIAVSGFAIGTSEVLFASTYGGRDGAGLSMSNDAGYTWSDSFLPPVAAALGLRMAFAGNLVLEAVPGTAIANCHVLFPLYGQRCEPPDTRGGALYVFRTDKTLKQMIDGQVPTLLIAWKQDPWDYWARHAPGAVLISQRVGTVSSSSFTLSDSGHPFGANNVLQNCAIRILSGTGAGQVRTIASSTSDTLTLHSDWAIAPDSTSDYQVVASPPYGHGLHCHCAAWVPQAANGEECVLYISFGDQPESRHICRIPGFDKLPAISAAQDVYGQAWNYDDSQVFVTGMQPTAMWGDNGYLYQLARDRDEKVVRSPDSAWDTTGNWMSWNTWAPYTSYYYQYNLDARAMRIGDRAFAVIANANETAPGQYGIFLGDPSRLHGLLRYVRGSGVLGDGYRKVFYAEGGDRLAVSGAAGGLIKNWLIDVPTRLVRQNLILVGNASVNLCPNSDFSRENGSLPDGYFHVRGSAAMEILSGGFGGTRYLRVTKATNDSDVLRTGGLPVVQGERVYAQIVYRVPKGSPANYDSLTFTLNWRDKTGSTFVMSDGPLTASYIKDQWLVSGLSAVVPSNAVACVFQVLVRNFAGALDLALPMLVRSAYGLPAIGDRGADVLQYLSSSEDWFGYSKASIEFDVIPLWPTDTDHGAGVETVCSVKSASGERLLLTWSYSGGFVVNLRDVDGRSVGLVEIGQIATLTRMDLCRFRIEFGNSEVSVLLDAGGGDVLQGSMGMPGVSVFVPAVIQLGGDQFDPAGRAWEGYYLLRAVRAVR